MKKLIGILIFVATLSGLSSCYKTSIEKPDNLISKDKFVKMMVDVYLIQGLNVEAIKLDSLKKITQTDLYFSVLKKYEIPDTVFIRSLIYYSSYPKEYEKIHTQIMNILSESEQQFKPKDKLNVGTE
jgi:hypothetical protein